MAEPISGAARALGGRLRELRESTFADSPVRQQALADVLGVSAPLVSSWEKGKAIPKSQWLDKYATLFASERSLDGSSLRLPSESELTSDELEARDTLRRDLRSLRSDAVRAEQPPADERQALGGLWYFRDGRPVRIVSPQVPESQLAEASPEHPELAFGELYEYSSIDALFELFGHIRAANPRIDVKPCKEEDLGAEDYTAHLVSLGGVDWNSLTARTPELLPDFPIRQVSSGDDPAGAHFEVRTEGDTQQFGPTLDDSGKILTDVGLFVRVPSPYNRKRTFTLCSAMYSVGTWGVVKALTDESFRDRNEEYVRDRFHGSDSFAILSRILVLSGHEVVTPDWSNSARVLYEWPEAT